MKRVFGMVEAVFDLLYLSAALLIGFSLILSGSHNPARLQAGIMAFVLAGGDAFHLLPRIAVILSGREERLRPVLGLGKLITSITMTIFYLLLWRLGLSLFASGTGFWSYTVYALAAVRIFLCLLPQNRWKERYPPVKWGIFRNIPFFLQGMIVAGLFLLHRSAVPALGPMWLAIILSFAFYLPVVLWANKNTKIGMLMLPKSCAYIWILAMCLLL